MWILYDAATGALIGGMQATEPVPGPGQAVQVVPQSALVGATMWVEDGDGSGFYDAPPAPPPPPGGMGIDFHGDAGTGLTLTNQPAAAQFLANHIRHRRRVDLSGFRQARLEVNVLVAGSAAAQLAARVHSAGSASIADYQTLGMTEVAAPLNLVGNSGSGWVDINPLHLADNRYLAIRQSGGDGVADPQIGNVTLFLR